LKSLRCRVTALVVKQQCSVVTATSTYKLFALPFSFLAAAPIVWDQRERSKMFRTAGTLCTTEYASSACRVVPDVRA